MSGSHQGKRVTVDAVRRVGVVSGEERWLEMAALSVGDVNARVNSRLGAERRSRACRWGRLMTISYHQSLCRASPQGWESNGAGIGGRGTRPSGGQRRVKTISPTNARDSSGRVERA